MFLNWKDDLKNLFVNIREIAEKPTKNINGTPGTKLWQFQRANLTQYWKKLNAKTLDEIPPEEWKTREFDNILLRLCIAVYKQITIEKWTKDYNLSFPGKGDFGITNNYRAITLNVEAA